MSADAIIELSAPTRLSRAHLLVRLLIGAATAGVAHVMGWPGALLYLGLPALAAIRISQVGGERYLHHDVPRVTRVLSWILGAYAYLALLTDRFPGDAPDEPVRFVALPAGQPAVQSAVLRVFTSIPAILFLAVVGFLGSVVWLGAAIGVLIAGRYPRSWFAFQCGVLRCHARWVGYHASITDRYPPFTLALGPTEPRAAAHAL